MEEQCDSRNNIDTVSFTAAGSVLATAKPFPDCSLPSLQRIGSRKGHTSLATSAGRNGHVVGRSWIIKSWEACRSFWKGFSCLIEEERTLNLPSTVCSHLSSLQCNLDVSGHAVATVQSSDNKCTDKKAICWEGCRELMFLITWWTTNLPLTEASGHFMNSLNVFIL